MNVPTLLALGYVAVATLVAAGLLLEFQFARLRAEPLMGFGALCLVLILALGWPVFVLVLFVEFLDSAAHRFFRWW